MKPATYIGHWPGQDTPVCEDHKLRMEGIGRAMGVTISFTPCEETVCKNCENEAKKKEVAEAK